MRNEAHAQFASLNSAFYLILFSILPGYWFLTRWYFTKYNIVRDSGYHVLFQSMVAGLVIFIAATALVTIGEKAGIELFRSGWLPSDYQQRLSGDYVSTLMISILIALVAPEIWNHFLDQEKATKRSAERSNDVMKLLMIQSIEQAVPVELTLNSDKCYIGLILKSDITRRQEPEIALVPILSGYRHSTTRELVITTNYSPIIKDFADMDRKKYRYDDFRVIVRMCEITTARLFHPEVYETFQNRRQAN